MAPKFLAFLLFGMLAIVAFDAADQRENTAPSANTVDNSSEVTVMDGPGLYPPVKGF